MGINQIWCVIAIIFVSMASIHNARLFDIYDVRSPFLGEVHAIPPSCFVPSSVYRWWDHCAMPPVSPAIIHLAGVALVFETPPGSSASRWEANGQDGQWKGRMTAKYVWTVEFWWNWKKSIDIWQYCHDTGNRGPRVLSEQVGDKGWILAYRCRMTIKSV